MKILITAGPTREPIDAVRFISNRASGRIGLSLAGAACHAGHEVTLLLGPTHLAAQGPPPGVTLHRFQTAAELEALLLEHFPICDVLIMAAAVADYRPARTETGKLHRTDQSLVLTLEPTPDLVAQVARRKSPDQKIIAFALEEPAELERRAQDKLGRKRVDAIVANPLQTMESEFITPLWLTAAGEREQHGSMTKGEFASWLVRKLTGWRTS